MNVALGGKLIDETEVECRPERIPDCVVGENVDIRLVCSTDAWKLVETVLENKAKRIICTCQSCNHDLHSEQSIICNACLRLYHFRCVGISSHPKLAKARSWFCRACHSFSM